MTALVEERLFCQRTGKHVPFSYEEHPPSVRNNLAIKVNQIPDSRGHGTRRRGGGAPCCRGAGIKGRVGDSLTLSCQQNRSPPPVEITARLGF